MSGEHSHKWLAFFTCDQRFPHASCGLEFPDFHKTFSCAFLFMYKNLWKGLVLLVFSGRLDVKISFYVSEPDLHWTHMPQSFLSTRRHPWAHTLRSFIHMYPHTHTQRHAVVDRESGCSSKSSLARSFWDAMGLYFKGQGQSSTHSPGSYTVIRPIRRLPQGGIQSLSLSVSIPLSNPTRNKSLTLSSAFLRKTLKTINTASPWI